MGARSMSYRHPENGEMLARLFPSFSRHMTVVEVCPRSITDEPHQVLCSIQANDGTEGIVAVFAQIVQSRCMALGVVQPGDVIRVVGVPMVSVRPSQFCPQHFAAIAAEAVTLISSVTIEAT